jgi:hypothetical protein
VHLFSFFRRATCVLSLRKTSDLYHCGCFPMKLIASGMEHPLPPAGHMTTYVLALEQPFTSIVYWAAGIPVVRGPCNNGFADCTTCREMMAPVADEQFISNCPRLRAVCIAIARERSNISCRFGAQPTVSNRPSINRVFRFRTDVLFPTAYFPYS